MRLCIIASLFLTFVFFPLSVDAWDWGNSNNFFLKKKIDDRWSFVTRSLVVSRDDMSDVFFGIVDGGLRYAWFDSFSTDIVYRGAWFETNSGWAYENRPLVNLNVNDQWQGYKLSHRSRFEFRIFNDQRKDDIRYRSEFRIITPYQITKYNFTPYIEEEFFYSFNEEQINMNWLSGGLRYKVNKNTILKVGYRWQTQKLSGTWNDRNVLVTGLLLFF